MNEAAPQPPFPEGDEDASSFAETFSGMSEVAEMFGGLLKLLEQQGFPNEHAAQLVCSVASQNCAIEWAKANATRPAPSLFPRWLGGI